MSARNLFAWRQLQRDLASSRDLPDLRTYEDRQHYRAILCSRREAKRQLARMLSWRRQAAHNRFDATLPALLRAQAE